MEDMSFYEDELFNMLIEEAANEYIDTNMNDLLKSENIRALIIKAFKEGFVANEISEIYAILNGTCNFILTKMKKIMIFGSILCYVIKVCLQFLNRK